MRRRFAHVVGSSPAEHPESGRSLLKVTVDRPWATAGQTYPATDIWLERDCPSPAFGAPIEWDHSHAWINGARYDKPENDSNPAQPLH